MSTQYMIIILSGLAAMVSCGIYIFITELTDPFRQAERARKKLKKKNHIKKNK